MDKLHEQCDCPHCKLIDDLNRPVDEQDPFVQLHCALLNCKAYMSFMHETDASDVSQDDITDYVNYSCNMSIMEHSVDVLCHVMQSLGFCGERMEQRDAVDADVDCSNTKLMN